MPKSLGGDPFLLSSCNVVDVEGQECRAMVISVGRYVYIFIYIHVYICLSLSLSCTVTLTPHSLTTLYYLPLQV